MQQGIDSKSVEHGYEFINKSVTKSFAATVIPGSNLDNFVIHFRSCYDLPLYCFVRDRRPSFRASKGIDEVGFE